jgi:TonB family protein
MSLANDCSIPINVGPSVFKPFRLSVLVCCAFLLMTAHASAQDTKTRRTTVGSSAVSVSSYKEIPAATGPCTSEECDWWNRLREAGNKLLQKGDQKSMSAYASLFVEGIAKSYKVPLADRPPQVLVFGPPVPPAKFLSQRRNGTVRLSVEFRADGSVGEIKVLSGLGTQVDQRCIQAAQGVIFLPAVKDRQFVTEWQTSEYKFAYGAAARK